MRPPLSLSLPLPLTLPPVTDSAFQRMIRAPLVSCSCARLLATDRPTCLSCRAA